MNREDLEHLTASGESLTVEFKRSTGSSGARAKRSAEYSTRVAVASLLESPTMVPSRGSSFRTGRSGKWLRCWPSSSRRLEALERYIRVGRPDLLHDPKQRAFFLTRLGGGAGITHVQRILGHSQITTTAEYAKDYAGALKKVIGKKHPREKEYRRKK